MVSGVHPPRRRWFGAETSPAFRGVALPLLAAGLGFVANGFEVRVFGTSGLVFGQVFALLIAAVFGPARGALAAVFAMIPTWVGWGHPYGMLLMGIEAGAIGWLMTRGRRDVLQASLLYWLTVGLPLTAFIVVWVLRIASPGHVGITVIYLVNAMIDAVVARVLLDTHLLHRALGQPLPARLATEGLQARLARHLIITAVLPLVALGVWIGSLANSRALAIEREMLLAAAHEAAAEVEDHLLQHRLALGLVASGLSRTGEKPVEARIEEDLGRQGLAFRRILVVDEAAVSVRPTEASGGPVLQRDGFRLRPENWADGSSRSWVQLDPATGRSVGLALGAAVLDPAGRRTMLIGVLDLEQLRQRTRFRSRWRSRDLLLGDAQGGILFTHLARADVAEPAPPPRRPEGVFLKQDVPIRGAVVPCRYLGVWIGIEGTDWAVHVREPVISNTATLARFYVGGLAALGVIVVVGVTLVQSTARRLSEPLVGLAARARELAEGRRSGDMSFAADLPHDLRSVASSIHEASHTLAETNDKLRQAVAERDLSHAELLDLTVQLERRVAERTAEVEKARAEAERGSRAKSEFLAVVSHELRTPLNVALGHIHLLLNHPQEKVTGRTAERIGKIKVSTNHLLALVNDLLDLAKLEAGRTELEVEAVDVRRLCEACAGFFQQEFERAKLEFSLQVAVQDGRLHADPRRLQQVLLNLLSNAVKFTPEGGRIGLRVGEHAGRGRVLFTVWDTGIGLTPEQLARLFRPFEQVDSGATRRFAGTGLGLSIVKRLVELHGGEVVVDSVPGRGSRFTVAVPYSPARPGPADGPGAAGEKFNQGGVADRGGVCDTNPRPPSRENVADAPPPAR